MGKPKKPSMPSSWDLIEDNLLNACRVWDLRARRYRHPHNGKEGEFYYLDSRDWVIVVARTVAGELVMVRQFRWGINALSWELPGGIIDTGEDPLVAGLRELKEETGYETEQGRIIGYCSPNPAILNNRCHIVLAENCQLTCGGTAWDEHEEIEVQALPEPMVFEWAKNTKIDHALALTGLLYYQLDKGA